MTNWKTLRDRLSEYEADPEQLLAWLVDFRGLCMTGITTQKPVGGKGVEDVLETYPAIALAATKEIRSLADHIRTQAETQETDRELVVIFEDAMVPEVSDDV